jgi:hypothetical protein
VGSRIKYIYTTIREILGVTAPETGDAVLIDDPSSGTWAGLTRDPSPHRKHVDESDAIGTMLLRGIAGGGPEGSFAERLEAEALAIAEERRVPGKPRNYLVLHLNGEVPDWQGNTEREVEQFVIRLNGAPKIGARDRANVTLASIVIAISQRTGRQVQLKRHAEGSVFFREDGKKVYAKELTAGSAALFVSGPWKADEQPILQAEVLALSGLASLDRVHQLYAASLGQADDRFRSFQSAWSALEIFVNKVFSQYEVSFLGGITSDSDPEAKQWYLDRIRDVMKDKYRLRDRFSLIAATLAPEEVDADMGEFVKAKRVRDALAHGQDVPDSHLPVESIHRILGKYLRLHAISGGPTGRNAQRADVPNN